MDRCIGDTEHFISRFGDLTKEAAVHATQVTPSGHVHLTILLRVQCFRQASLELIFN